MDFVKYTNKFSNIWWKFSTLPAMENIKTSHILSLPWRLTPTQKKNCIYPIKTIKVDCQDILLPTPILLSIRISNFLRNLRLPCFNHRNAHFACIIIISSTTLTNTTTILATTTVTTKNTSQPPQHQLHQSFQKKIMHVMPPPSPTKTTSKNNTTATTTTNSLKQPSQTQQLQPSPTAPTI